MKKIKQNLIQLLADLLSHGDRYNNNKVNRQFA
jgi:hypothetical protein